MKKLKVNENCICCGACISIAPELFDYSDEGTSKPIDKEITEEYAVLAHEAIDTCPVGAISLEEVTEIEGNNDNDTTEESEETELPKAA